MLMKAAAYAILASLLIVGLWGYSTPLALELAYMSEVAYEDSSKIQSWKCQYCAKYSIEKPKVFSNSAGGIQGFIGFSKNLKAIIVAFRGSSNIQNWILNINSGRSSYSSCTGCQVHSGFNQAYNLVKNNVHSLMEQYMAMYRGSRIMVTGHSLGGALAILAASDFITMYNKVDEVYTFGQPRVGNTPFGVWYEQKIPQTYRLVHYADIVPHLPPSNFGFSHSNHQIWYTKDMQHYKQCAAEDSECANSISVTNYSVDDHSLDNYIKLKVSMVEVLEGHLRKDEDSHYEKEREQTDVGAIENWKAEEERKVNAALNELRQKQNSQALVEPLLAVV